MATQRVLFCKFVPQSRLYLDTIVSKLLLLNDEQNRFIIEEQSDEYVSGCYFIQQARSEVQYVLSENKFETVISSKLNIVRFEIDSGTSLLTIWGNRFVSQRLVTLIAMASNYDIIIDEYKIDLKKVIKRIGNNNNIILQKMKLDNVQIDTAILASCNVVLTNIQNSFEILRKYSDNVSQLTFSFGEKKNDSVAAVTIYNTGTIVIHREREKITESFIEEIRNIAIGLGETNG